MYEQKILQLIFNKPMTHFGVRELSRTTNLDTKTVMKYLKSFVERGLVIRKKEKRKFAFYEPNRLSVLYRHEKSSALTKKILESGLITYLEEKIQPKVIVLFGSARKGTYHAKSDIDLFVQAESQKVNLENFERKLGHRIQILFEKDLKELNTGLLENIYNGIVLSGKLEVIR